MKPHTHAALAAVFVLAQPSFAMDRPFGDDELGTTLAVTASALSMIAADLSVGALNGEHYRLTEDAGIDAAYFVASSGSAEPGPVLRALIDRVRADAGARSANVTDLEIAERLLGVVAK